MRLRLKLTTGLLVPAKIALPAQQHYGSAQNASDHRVGDGGQTAGARVYKRVNGRWIRRRRTSLRPMSFFSPTFTV